MTKILFHQGYIVEHSVIFRRNCAVYVAFPEKPALEITLGLQLVEVRSHLALLLGVELQKLLQRCGGLVCYYVINGISVLFEVSDSVCDFLLRGNLLLPPHFAFAFYVLVVALSATEGENTLAVKVVHLATHKLTELSRYNPDLSAVPFLNGIVEQYIVIFVAAVNEKYIIALSSERFEYALFFFSALPYTPEI